MKKWGIHKRMLSRNVLRLLWAGGFALWLASVVLRAAHAPPPPWEKPVDSWSAEDVAALLSNSPWALQTVAEMEDPADAIEPAPPGPPDTGERGPNKKPWDGGVGRNRMGHLATIPVTIRWDSALPVRQAQKDLAAPPQFYVISLSGLVPPGRYRAAGQTETSSTSDGSFDSRNPEEVLEAFMAYSMISEKGGPDLGPENVKLDPVTGVVRIFFPRKPALDPDQKEVLFVTHFGKLHVRAKFRLASMKYHGNLEL
jgi:hypothetical protein